MAGDSFSRLERARSALTRVRAAFEAGRADPWQVAEAELKHQRALDAALDAGPELELQLVDVPRAATPAPPLPLPVAPRRR